MKNITGKVVVIIEDYIDLRLLDCTEMYHFEIVHVNRLELYLFSLTIADSFHLSFIKIRMHCYTVSLVWKTRFLAFGCLYLILRSMSLIFYFTAYMQPLQIK